MLIGSAYNIDIPWNVGSGIAVYQVCAAAGQLYAMNTFAVTYGASFSIVYIYGVNVRLQWRHLCALNEYFFLFHIESDDVLY
jgi:hypothetical protein